MISDRKLNTLINERLKYIEEIGFPMPAMVTSAAKTAGTVVKSALPAASSTIFTISSLVGLASAAYNAFISKKARACQNYEGSAKSICNIKFDIQASQMALNKLSEARSKCSKTKNLEACNKKFNEKIQMHRDKIKQLTDNLRELQKYGIVEK